MARQPKTSWALNRRIELNYLKALKAINKIIEPALAKIDTPTGIVQWLQNFANMPELNKFAQAEATRMVGQVNKETSHQWRKLAAEAAKDKAYKIREALKVELQNTPRGSVISQMVAENAKYIKSIPQTAAKDVTERVKEETYKGRRAESIVNDIRADMPGLTESHMKLIARTETAKAHSALTQARAEELGMDWYEWDTSEDERVRKSHAHMQGVLCNWNEPPNPELLIHAKHTPPEPYSPGNIYNCRCNALPLTDYDEVSWPHKVYRNGEITTMTLAQFKEISGGQV
jgi:SPP1 gp7 family putative phage head morphogenesis protein